MKFYTQKYAKLDLAFKQYEMLLLTTSSIFENGTVSRTRLETNLKGVSKSTTIMLDIETKTAYEDAKIATKIVRAICPNKLCVYALWPDRSYFQDNANMLREWKKKNRTVMDLDVDYLCPSLYWFNDVYPKNYGVFAYSNLDEALIYRKRVIPVISWIRSDLTPLSLAQWEQTLTVLQEYPHPYHGLFLWQHPKFPYPTAYLRKLEEIFA